MKYYIVKNKWLEFMCIDNENDYNVSMKTDVDILLEINTSVAKNCLYVFVPNPVVSAHIYCSKIRICDDHRKLENEITSAKEVI